MIVLDTHAFVWLADGSDRLSEPARRAIAEDAAPAISTISVQEIAYLALRDGLELDRPVGAWVGDALKAHEVRALPLTVSIAVRAGSLDPTEFPEIPPTGSSTPRRWSTALGWSAEMRTSRPSIRLEFLW